VHIFQYKHTEKAELSENSLTIFGIYAIITKMHEICYGFIDNNVYSPIIG
jgi:hypothetical protein